MTDRSTIAVRSLLKAALLAVASLPSAAAHAGRIDRWSSEIALASARFDIPAAWIRRVMRAESGGQTLLHGRPIVSAAGAMGLMQLMPGTWREMRALLGLGPDPFDPHDNILAGTFYLKRMYGRFGYPGLFAAYHAGPARYAAFLAGRRGLPAQTISYVAAVAPAGRRNVTIAAQPPSGISAVRPKPLPATAGQSLNPASSGLFVALSGSQ